MDGYREVSRDSGGVFEEGGGEALRVRVNFGEESD